MTIRELLEHAHLDALGMLDDDDRASFDAAFGAASEPVKRQVRAEQARWAGSLARLSDEQPPASLRARVLAAVIEAQATGGGMAGGSIAVVGPGGVARSERVSAYWRSGALVGAAATLVMSAAFLYISNVSASLRDRYEGDQAANTAIKAFGKAEFLTSVVHSPTVTRVLFARAAGATSGAASLFMDPALGSRGQLWCSDFSVPEGQSLRLAVVDETNRIIEELQEFRTVTPYEPIEVGTSSMRTGTRLALVSAPIGQVASRGCTVLLVATISA